MNGRELALLLCFGSFALMVVALLVGVHTTRRKRAFDLEQRRLDLLEKALQHPVIDEALRRELMRTLAAGNPKPDTVHGAAAAAEGAATHGNWWPTLWFGAGWLLFVGGGCMVGAHALRITNGVDIGTMLPAAILGFAMLTLPLGLRELQARRARPQTPQTTGR